MIRINYFKENKKKTIGIIAVISLAILAIAFVVTATTSSILETETSALVKPLNSFTMITPSPENPVLQDAIVNAVDDCKEVKKTQKGYVQTISMETLFGSINTFCVYINDSETVKELLSSCSLKVSAGVLPEVVKNADTEIKNYQVAMHESLLKNKKLKVGDDIWLEDGYYKICGALSGDKIMSIGSRSRFIDNYHLNDATVVEFVFPKTSVAAMNESLDKELKQVKENYSIYEYEKQEQAIEESFETANFFLMWIYIVVVLIISVTLCMFIVNVYNNRIDEFAILCSIGYTKKSINRMVLKEVALLSLWGWSVGYILSLGMLYVFRKILFEPKGLVMPLFSVLALIISLFLPISVLFIASSTVSRKLKKQDLISLIR